MASAFLIVTKKKSKSCYSYVCTSYRHYPSLMRQLSLCWSIFLCLFLSLSCRTFRPAFGALQTLVDIVIFCIFCAKKLKKARNLKQNFAKNTFFSLSQFFPLFSFSCTNCHSTFFCSNYLSVCVCLISRIFFSFFCGLYSVMVFWSLNFPSFFTLNLSFFHFFLSFFITLNYYKSVLPSFQSSSNSTLVFKDFKGTV